MAKQTKIEKRASVVDQAIREAVNARFGSYTKQAVEISLALQFIVQAMTSDNSDRQASNVKLALDYLKV